MKTKLLTLTFFLSFAIMLSSCSKYVSQVTFPAVDDVFLTTGDGDIQKPYTPLGHLIYYKAGFRIPLIFFGYIPFGTIDPDYEIKTAVKEKVKQMGGDGLINMKITYTPAKTRLLGFFATGGSVQIAGTVIKR